MNPNRAALAQYLRQRMELGEREVFLETLAPAEALALAGDALTRDAGTRGRGDAEKPDAGTRRHGDTGTPRVPASPTPRVGVGGVQADLLVAAAKENRESAVGELVALGKRAAVCRLCRLHEGRRSVVFGEGNPSAQVVVVGEAPGGEEDRTGRPFVGPAGKLLDKLLLSAGFPRQDVYICNVLKCRPPQNRDPQPDEVHQCSTNYLHAQIELIAPRVLVAVGKFAAQTLIQSQESISKLRGRIHSYRGIPLLATFHPAFLLRSPQWTRAAWSDFQFLRQVLDEQS